MSVDKFGHYNLNSKTTAISGPQGIRGVGFKQTAEGDYDLQKRRLINLKDPIEMMDAATKNYIDIEINKLRDINKESIESYQYIDKKIDKIASTLNELDKNVVQKTFMREYINTSLNQMYKWVCETFEKNGGKVEKSMKFRSPWSPSLPGGEIPKQFRSEFRTIES